MIAHTLATTLDAAIPAPPAALLAPAAYADARAVADRFPASIARWIYLESRLSSPSDRVDITFAVDGASADLLGVQELGSRRLSAFARLWRRHCSITRLWLEFDIDAPSPTAAPGLFAEFSEKEHAIRWPPHLAHCIRQFPSGGAVRYAGLFPSRGTTATRLCITGLPDNTIAPYLTSIGWSGSISALDRELSTLGAVHGAGVGIVDIDVEPGGEIGPAIGLEYLFRRDAQTRATLAESAFLDALVARALCTPPRRRALDAFPLSRYTVLPHELWESVLHRRVNHVKLTFEHDAIRDAKAYLAIGHLPRRRRSIE
jgi:hypothetical protein